MKKILIGYITKDLGSGINQYIINFVNNIHEEIEIDFLTREDPKYIEQIKDDILKNIKYNNIYTIPNNKKPISALKALRNIMKNNNYDIAYFNVSSAHDSLGLIAAKQCKIEKRIVHSHSSSASGKTFIHRGIKKIINSLGKIILSNTANSYLTCSDKAAKWLFPAYIYKTNDFETIYNAIDSKKFCYNETVRKKIRKQLKLKDEFLIGHIGRINDAVKNNIFVIDIFYEFVKREPNSHLICIGDGPDMKKIKEYAKNKGLLDKITFTGRVNNVEEYLQAIDAFVLPSKFEGLPITAIEAQFSNIPCFVSDKITKEVVIGNNTKMLPINNSSIWANEIIKVKGERNNKLLKSSKSFELKSNNQTSKIINLNSNNINDHIEMDGLINFELLFSFLFMLEGFFQACNITVGSKIISFVLWPMTALGFLILLYRLLKFKKFKFGLRNIVLLIFDLTLIISSLLFIKYKLYLNIKFFILMFFQFGILYFYPNKFDEKKRFNLSKLLNIFLMLSSLLVLGSFYTLLANYNAVINTVNAAKVFGISSGRLYGIFWDPNIGALISTVAFAISLHKIIVTKNKFIKILSTVLAFLFAIYVSLSDSRMGILCLIICSLIYVTLTFISKNISSKKTKILLTIIVLISILFSLQGRNTYNKIVTEINKREIIIEKINKKYNKSVINENTKRTKDKHIQIERKYDLNKDISNRRFDIWKSGLEIVKKEPVFGVGHANVLPYVKDELPNTYIINNTQSDFSSMHNMFLDVAVSQGLVGLILYLYFVIWTGVLLLKNFKYLINLNEDNTLFITIILIELISSMFITEIIYIDSPMSVIFWICLGQLMNYIDFKKKKVQYEK